MSSAVDKHGDGEPLAHLPAPTAPPRAAAAPGTPTTHVGKYTLYEVIGEGAFGKVKLGVNRESSERVAVKIMDKKEIREQDLSAQVRREIYIMRSLTHRHIVRMHEVLTSNTKLYIVMELVTGGELFERLEKHGRVDESLARRYFQQLVDGVDFCHKNGVAHRDLKPENLLLDEEGNIRITDFGFSSMKGADVNAGLLFTQCGTPDYCAPEIIERAEEGYNGAKVDVWSCGIILFALLAGRLPFCHDETEKLYDLITSCRVTYPPFIMSSAKDLLKHMLVRDPAKRFSLAEIKQHPWFLMDYRGDDMKKLVKPPFYNKSAASAQRSRTPNLTSVPTDGATQSPTSPPLPAAASPSDIPAHAPALEVSPAGGEVTPGVSPSSGTRGSDVVDPSDSIGDKSPVSAGAVSSAMPSDENGRSALSSSPMSSGRVAAMVRAHELHSYPTDASSSGDPNAPPPHSVFTKVLDRPATPASSRVKTNSGAPVSEMTRQPDQGATKSASRPAISGGIVPEGPGGPALAASLSTGGNKADSQGRVSSSPTETSAEGHSGENPGDAACRYDDQDVGGEGGDLPGAGDTLGTKEAEKRANDVVTTTERNEDVGSLSSDGGSVEVEDYRNKPVPVLSLPLTERFVRHQTAQDIRAQQQLRQHQFAQDQQLQQQHQQVRHRSDTHVKVMNGASRLAQGAQQPPQQLASAHIRRVNSPSASTVANGVGGRAASPFRRSAGISASPPAVEGRGSLLAGRHLRYSDSPRQGTSPVSTSSGEKHPGTFRLPNAAAGATVPWHDSSSQTHNLQSGGVDMSPSGGDESAWFSAVTPDALSQRMWNIFLGWRAGLTDEAKSHHASPELRMEHRAIQGALASMTNPEEKLAVYEQFMSLFAKHGLGVVSSGQAGAESVDELERSSGSLRRMPTDLSSEDDGGWSPTIYEPARNKSDLNRRREVSDLLTRWIRKYSGGSAGGPGSGGHATRENSTDGPFGGSEDGGSMDIAELQRLMRQQQGGRDDSVLAEEMERLMRTMDHVEASGDSPSYSSGNGSRAQDGAGTRWSVPTVEISVLNIGRGSSNRSGRPASHTDQSESLGELSAAGSSSRAAGPQSASVAGLGDLMSNGSQVVGNTAVPSSRRGGRKPDTAASIGLSDVEYYGSDRRGVSTKLKGRLHLLTQMKARNQRMLESTTFFQSSQEPESILEILCGILHQMKGHVTLKRETKRKLKVSLPMRGGVLYAVIELTASEDGLTTVNFSRSRQDRGRTDTMSFTHFYDTVRQQFIAEVQAGKGRPHNPRRNRGDAPSSTAVKRISAKRDELQQLDFEVAPPFRDVQQAEEPFASSGPVSWSRAPVVSATRGVNGPVRTAPRAASDMR